MAAAAEAKATKAKAKPKGATLRADPAYAGLAKAPTT